MASAAENHGFVHVHNMPVLATNASATSWERSTSDPTTPILRARHAALLQTVPLRHEALVARETGLPGDSTGARAAAVAAARPLLDAAGGVTAREPPPPLAAGPPAARRPGTLFSKISPMRSSLPSPSVIAELPANRGSSSLTHALAFAATAAGTGDGSSALIDSGVEWNWSGLTLRNRSHLRGTLSPTAGFGDRLVREGMLREEVAALRVDNERLRRELESERRARLEAQARSPLAWVEQRVAQRGGYSAPVAAQARPGSASSSIGGGGAGSLAAIQHGGRSVRAGSELPGAGPDGSSLEQPSVVSSEGGDVHAYGGGGSSGGRASPEFGAVFLHAAHAPVVARAIAASSSRAPSPTASDGGRGGFAAGASTGTKTVAAGAGAGGQSQRQAQQVLLAAAAAAAASLSPRSARSPAETGALLAGFCRDGNASAAAAIVEWADLVDLDVRFDSDRAPRTTPLVWACGKGHEALALLLIERGADVSAVDGGGESALSAAVKGGLPEAALALLDHGANAAHMDRPRAAGGQSILEYAYRRPLMMARVSERLIGR